MKSIPTLKENEMFDKKKQIEELLDHAMASLDQARVLSKEVPNLYFDFDGVGYGAGAVLYDGKWTPSSQSC